MEPTATTLGKDLIKQLPLVIYNMNISKLERL